MTAQQRSAGGGDDDDADDDTSAFRAAMRGVRPLPQGAQAPAEPHARRARPRTARAPVGGKTAGEPAPPIDAPAAAPGDRLSFRRPGVRDQQMRRLRRGGYPVEDELDLHGLTMIGAHGLLGDFIDASREEGRRCVRIIHGKGMRSGARGAVLKSAVNEWLRRRHDVVAFTSARPIDGGTGAVYVLLRA